VPFGLSQSPPKPRDRSCQKGGNIGEYYPLFGNSIAGAFASVQMALPVRKVNYLNVLDAERRLFEAQLDLAQGQTDVFLTLVNIYKALGGGWVMDAETIMLNEWSSSSSDCLSDCQQNQCLK
jgi:hypothetical protein